ncbi:hypothetical protein LMH87_011176 [Akanthomyces muscarius]|uniref:Alpha N-terminal protein methyltransferase 1 n=1 Tax=Akanthomyces muscarius TaxID=2231603 RepID=A0A9W8UKH6_AKAMU|nr:hypothetical protein LMH87_011176 [Akanthomyces muscarius]KAJ4150424.1 hypothetical protein LMH87_011176 [Akanthomyces muscarius]
MAWVLKVCGGAISRHFSPVTLHHHKQAGPAITKRVNDIATSDCILQQARALRSQGVGRGGLPETMPPKGKEAKPDSLISKEDGLRYWQNATADVDGMLGGVPSLFSPISRVDLQGSRTFLARLGIGTSQGRQKVTNCVEGGAGIGRVTQGLLANVAANIDIVEPVGKFTAQLRGKPGVRRIFNVGLEEWAPAADAPAYDLVWTQWCLGHLTDAQLVQYLRRCKEALVPETGVIVIKENLSTSGEDVFDPVDSCVTRQEETWKRLFEEAGLRIVRHEPQRGLPETGAHRLLPVMMYALKP